MSLVSTLRRNFTKEEDNVEYLPRATQATLDDLYAKALTLGEPKLGITFEPHGAEIRIHDHKAGGDYIWVRSKMYPTIKENLAACIQRAELIVNLYRSM